MVTDHTVSELVSEEYIQSELMREFRDVVEPGHVLAFVTGANQEPAGGFAKRPQIRFCHNGVMPGYPEASTCTNTLTLYVNDDSVTDKFHSMMLIALMNGICFTAR